MLGEGSTSDVPPAAFGRFRVLHQIAVGSLGPVFRGEDPDTHEPVAIKHFRLELTRDQALQAVGALRELVGTLPDHPNLPHAVDAGLHEGDPYFVTSFATGDPLDTALQTYGPAAINDALPRLQGLARALDKAAAAQIWHGGLRPRDIIVSPDDTQLTGLGIVPVVARAGLSSPRRDAYTAPEISGGQRSSAAADQFSLAAVAFEWLFGRPLTRSAQSVLEIPTLSGVDMDALTKAFGSALAPDPAQRFENCSAFVNALRRSTERAAGGRPAIRAPKARPKALAPLPFDAEESSQASSVAGDEQLFAVTSPEWSVADLHLDPEPPAPVPLTSPLSAHTEPDRTVEWRGRLTAGEGAAPSSGGFTFGTVGVALIGGVAIGLVAGYLLANAPSSGTGQTPTGESIPAPAAGSGRDFTDAPLASNAGNPAPEPAARVDAAKDGGPDVVPTSGTETARLLVRSTPAGAIVTIDGTPRGTTPMALRDLAFGTHTVSIGRPGYDTAERRVTLTADRPSRSVEVVLASTRAARSSPTTGASAAVRTGALTVESRPAGASVALDGRVAGKTPLTMDAVPPGAHTIRIERAGYRAWTTTVDIKAGERARVAASLVGGRDPE